MSTAVSGSQVKKIIQALDQSTEVQKLGRRHFYYSGHGGWHPTYGEFIVPSGRVIHFYCKHRDTISDLLGQTVESAVGFAKSATPYETVKAGAKCYNYLLTPPTGLDIHNHNISPFAVITDKKEGEHLADLLERMPETIGGEVHWAACRYVA